MKHAVVVVMRPLLRNGQHVLNTAVVNDVAGRSQTLFFPLASHRSLRLQAWNHLGPCSVMFPDHFSDPYVPLTFNNSEPNTPYEPEHIDHDLPGHNDRFEFAETEAEILRIAA